MRIPTDTWPKTANAARNRIESSFFFTARLYCTRPTSPELRMCEVVQAGILCGRRSGASLTRGNGMRFPMAARTARKLMS